MSVLKTHGFLNLSTVDILGGITLGSEIGPCGAGPSALVSPHYLLVAHTALCTLLHLPVCDTDVSPDSGAKPLLQSVPENRQKMGQYWVALKLIKIFRRNKSIKVSGRLRKRRAGCRYSVHTAVLPLQKFLKKYWRFTLIVFLLVTLKSN